MIIDGHSDLLYDITHRRLAGERQTLARVHESTLRQSQVEGLILAVWTNATQTSFWKETPFSHPDAYRARTELQFTSLYQDLQESPGFRLVRNIHEADSAHKAGQIYCFLSIEGMAAIQDDPVAGIDWYQQQGVRMGMLTWNEENALATGSGGCPQNPLTTRGRQAIRAMETRGILPDVSHLNDGGFADVIRITNGVVMASHTNCRALCDVPRNLNDMQLRAIRDTGGVIGLNSWPGFVHSDPEQQTIKTLARHAAHMAEVIGTEHITFGFDFCWYMGAGNDSVQGLKNAAQIPDFITALREIGFHDKEIMQMSRENLRRILA